MRGLPPCNPSNDHATPKNSQVQVGNDGSAFVVVQEDDNNDSAFYDLCVFKRDSVTGSWANLGYVVENRIARDLQPAFGASSARIGLKFSFDIRTNGTLFVAYVHSVLAGNPALPVDHVFYRSDADGVPPWNVPVEISYGENRREHQMQPTAVASGDYPAITFYETVSLGGDPGTERTLRVVGVVQDQQPSVGFTRVDLDQQHFDPCPTTASYFGDYISMVVLPRAGRDQLFSVWADSRDGCASQGSVAETYHQHTYGALWQ